MKVHSGFALSLIGLEILLAAVIGFTELPICVSEQAHEFCGAWLVVIGLPGSLLVFAAIFLLHYIPIPVYLSFYVLTFAINLFLAYVIGVGLTTLFNKQWKHEDVRMALKFSVGSLIAFLYGLLLLALI